MSDQEMRVEEQRALAPERIWLSSNWYQNAFVWHSLILAEEKKKLYAPDTITEYVRADLLPSPAASERCCVEPWLKRIEDDLNAASEERYQSLREWEQLARRWESEGDQYGKNFHQGMAAGANWCDIYYRRINRTIDAIRAEVGAEFAATGPTGRSERDGKLATLGFNLSTWAASIRWSPNDRNTQEWLNGLREHIEAFQLAYQQSGLFGSDVAATTTDAGEGRQDRHPIEIVIEQWRSTLTPDSVVSDEDAEDLVLRLIAGRSPQSSTVTPGGDAREAAIKISSHFGLQFGEASIAQAAAIIERHFPPPEATAAGMGAQVRASEIVRLWVAELEYAKLPPGSMTRLTGLIAEHCTTTPAVNEEVDRGGLCEECEQFINEPDGNPRTFVICGTCWNMQQEKLSEARAKAIGECVRELRRRANHAESTANHLPNSERGKELHAEARTMRAAAKWLQSLTQQQGEGGS